MQGILNPMQAFLNTLAFHGWTGLDIDLSLQRRRELTWDSASTSIATTGGYNPMMTSTLLYQSHVQDGKTLTGNGHQLPSDAVSILSESNTTDTGIFPQHSFIWVHVKPVKVPPEGQDQDKSRWIDSIATVTK